MAEPIKLSDVANTYVQDIDSTLIPEFSIGLAQIFNDTDTITKKQDGAELLDKVADAVDAYFKKKSEELADEKAKLEKSLTSLDALYKTTTDAIKKECAASGIGFLTPSFIARDRNREEDLNISEYSDEVAKLVKRLASKSDYVADLSDEYDGYKIGSWYFSGEKSYLVSAPTPTSPIIDIAMAANEIGFQLDLLAASMPG